MLLRSLNRDISALEKIMSRCFFCTVRGDETGNTTDYLHQTIIHPIKAEEVEQLVDPSNSSAIAGIKECNTLYSDDRTQLLNKHDHYTSKRKKTMNDVLDEVLSEAISMKDKGINPDVDTIYKKTQERIYEAEHGKKASSENSQFQKQYLPFPPDMSMMRLEPIHTAVDISMITGQDINPQKARYRMCGDVLEDPWPQRAITSTNPVLTREEMDAREIAREQWELKRAKEKAAFAERSVEIDVEEDEEELKFDDYKKMYRPRQGFDPVEEFVDAIDEHFFWEQQYIKFIRDVPLWQRRSLPYLQEHYRIVTHRLARAENRYIACRDKALPKIKASAKLFADTEERIARSRKICTDTLKSLSSPNYDSSLMKKQKITGRVMTMTDEEYCEWGITETHRKNALIAELTTE